MGQLVQAGGPGPASEPHSCSKGGLLARPRRTHRPCAPHCRLQTRNDVRDALQHAEREGISRQDRLHRTFRWLERCLTSSAALSFVLGSACVSAAAASAMLLARGGQWKCCACAMQG